MAAAALALPEAERHRVPTSVRWTGEEPRRRCAGPAGLVAEVRAAVADELAAMTTGTIAVLSTDPAALGELPGSVAVHTPGSAKGLEFDVVILAGPKAIAAACPADLYVAMTRPTQRLVLVEDQ